MNTWSSGYVTEVDYTHGYYRELSPVLMTAVAHWRSVGCRVSRPMRYLELGFGQGLSFAIHAAACPGEYWGTDFNPAHAAGTRHLLDAAGIAAEVRDASFAELAREDLPEFDIIALHGIWSWISDENREVIVDLIRRRLAFGGLLYISYNVTPGWAPVMPLRQILKMHADLAGSGGSITRRIDDAIGFTQRLIDVGAAYFAENPALAERLKLIAGQDRSYLAHEYFNRDWQPMPFAEVADRLSAAKLEFLSSTDPLDLLEFIHLTPEMQALLGEVTNPVLQETVRDYLLNRQFRKDLFIRGRRSLAPLEQRDLLQAQRFCLLCDPADVPAKLAAGRREVELQAQIYTPLLATLAEDSFAPKTASAILASPGWAGRPMTTLMQALSVLVGAGFAAPAQPEEVVAAARANCAALNRQLFERTRLGSGVSHAASPVTGGGVLVNRFNQLFLAARNSGLTEPAQWAQAAWQSLNDQGQRLMRNGATLETAEENLAELTSQATAFAQKNLPILTALGIG